MSTELKIGILVSYDWELLEHSLPLAYPLADRIWLSMDENARTWAGDRFSFDRASFFRLVKKLDPQGKVYFHEGDFYRPGQPAMENETDQRNRLSQAMGENGWQIHLDADEYLLDGETLVADLQKTPLRENKTSTVFANWIPIIKKGPQGFFIVKFRGGFYETFPLAFHRPRFRSGRRTGFQNRLSRCRVFHQTLAREPEEVKAKLANWGHGGQFDTGDFFRRWEALSEKNYKNYRNLHASGDPQGAHRDLSPPAGLAGEAA